MNDSAHQIWNQRDHAVVNTKTVQAANQMLLQKISSFSRRDFRTSVGAALLGQHPSGQ